MRNLVVRLRLVQAAFTADREGRAGYRRLERESADHRGPADAVGRAAVADRCGAARGRTLRRIQGPVVPCGDGRLSGSAAGRRRP